MPHALPMTKAASLLAAALAASAALAAPGDAPVMYGSIPADLPGNVTSQAFEAWDVSEAGDRVTFVPGTGGMVRKVAVILSSWACEKGSGETCETKKGRKFDHPITLNLYADGGAVPGALIASITRTFRIPYRPSASPGCPEGRWYDAADGLCYSGVAAEVTFDFPSPGVAVPDTVIWTVAFNTTHAGASPLGEGAPCYGSAAGCPYDSLNLGAETFAGVVGTDVDPDGAFLDADSDAYCDLGAGGTGVLRFDDGCWAGFRPLAEFVGATSKDCRKNGWQAFANPSFPSEAACKAFFDSL